MDAPPPEVPAQISTVGTEVWHLLWSLGVYSPATDVYVIERYASLHDRRASLLGLLTVDGLVATGYSGQTVLHPAARYLSDVEKAMTQLESKLGLSPEARGKLGLMKKAAEVTEGPSLERFMASIGP